MPARIKLGHVSVLVCLVILVFLVVLDVLVCLVCLVVLVILLICKVFCEIVRWFMNYGESLFLVGIPSFKCLY